MSGFDSRIHRARRITRKGFGAFFFMPRVRTRTPIASMLSARSNTPVSETISFSNRVPSMPEAIRQSMVSAPAGPSVVMTCMTLIIWRLKLHSSTGDRRVGSRFTDSCSSPLLERNGRFPEHAFCVPGMRKIYDVLVQFFVCLDHRRHVVVFSCPLRGGHPH